MSTTHKMKFSFLAVAALVLIVSFTLISCGGGGGGGGGGAALTYTVTYDGNGSTGGSVPSDNTNYEQGQTVTVLGNTGALVKTGNTFAGWNTQANGNGTTYTQSQTFAMGAVNVVLYAKWTASGPDTTPPTVLSSTPADLAANVMPASGTITVIFNEAMNTVSLPTVTTEAWNGSAWVSIPNTGTTLTWTNSTTLSITMSWIQFPEMTQIRWTLSAAGLEDAAANQIASQVQRSFTTTSRNTYFAIADTGQTECIYWNGVGYPKDPDCFDSSPTYTIGNADSPYGLDGHHINLPRARSFTGPAQNASFTSDYTTADNVANLLWKTCTEGKGGAACDSGTGTAINWYSAVNACAALNTANSGAGYAARTNWRLPTRTELESLPEYTASAGERINATHFPGTLEFINEYWSTSSELWGGSWMVGLNWATGGEVNSVNKSDLGYVRCVSGSDSSTLQTFIDNGNGSVTDNATSLIWQKCSKGENNDAACSGTAAGADWASAFAYCENLNLGARTDWRLPNINELRSIADISREAPSIDTTYFPGTVAAGYWSSTAAGENFSSWGVDFSGSIAGWRSIIDVGAGWNVRCVTGP